MAQEQDPHTDWGVDDLPGMWTPGDFTGGDPDERSYAQREADGALGWVKDYDNEHGRPQAIFESLVLKPLIEQTDRDIALLASLTAAHEAEPVGYDGQGAPLYAHQIDPEGWE